MLHWACKLGYVDIVTVLLGHPDIDVNKQTDGDTTALFFASIYGHDAVVALLLSRSDIDVNKDDQDNCTAFDVTCYHDKMSCLQLLLQDPRLIIDTKHRDDESLLHYLVYNHKIDIIKWIIALSGGHNLGFRESTFDAITVSERDLDNHMHEGIKLLQAYRDNPDKVQFDVRIELGLKSLVIADLYTLIIFICDDLLTIKRYSNQNTLVQQQMNSDNIVRFFNITTRLPIELQMLMCHRVFDSTGSNIRSSESELRFRHLARSQSQSLGLET